MTGSPSVNAARWELLSQVGIQHGRLRNMEERLDTDYRVNDYGYAQLADLSDVRLRAVVSDQILRTTHAIGDNLLAAGLHAERLGQLVGEGRPLPRGPDAVAVLRGESNVSSLRRIYVRQ